MLHYIIISFFIAVIFVLQLKVFLSTKSKLKVLEDAFYIGIEKWVVYRKGEVNQLTFKSVMSMKELAQKTQYEFECMQKEVSSLSSEIDKLHHDKAKVKEYLCSLEEKGKKDTEDFLHALNHLDSIESEIDLYEEKLFKAQNESDTIKRESDEEKSKIYSHSISNSIQKKYIDSINQYLEKNRNRATDFHLIKNIVDRNCESVEEEIQSQIPVPLYLGLVGTMLGIIVGVIYLVTSGALENLLSPYVAETMHEIISEQEYNKVASDGVGTLLLGVGIAMICSIAGIILTTVGSWKSKICISGVEADKNDFLSWMQAELLPQLNNDAASALEKLSENLSDFNEEFASHTEELSTTLSKVQDTTEGQAKLFESINDLNISKIAKANIEVYEKLKSCTDEIGKVGNFIGNINLYLEGIKELTTKIDDAQERTKMIEEMGRFFKDERANLETMRGVVSQSIGSADAHLREASDKLKISISNQYDALTQHNTECFQRFKKLMNEQEQTLQNKSSELSIVIEELRKFGSIKSLLSNFSDAIKSQNSRLNALVGSIEHLAMTRPNPRFIPDRSGGVEPNKMWYKYSMLAIGSVIAISLIVIISLMITHWSIA